MKLNSPHRGAALAAALCTLLIVMLIAGAVVKSLVTAHRQSRREQDELQAGWLAEAAVMRATAQLARQADYTSESWRPAIGTGSEDRGVAQIRVERADSPAGRRQIVVQAHYPDHEWRRASAAREITLTIPPTRSAPAERAP
jgi:type II secretory pathway component PulK